MIEAGLVAGQLADGAIQQSQQSLPAVQHRDADRFQDVMTGKVQIDEAIQAQNVETSDVLQFVAPGQSAEPGTGLVDNLISQASGMDARYHSLMEQMANRPSIDEYFSSGSATGSGGDDMLTYHPKVSTTGGTDGSGDMSDIFETMANDSKAALAYHRDMNDWAMGFRMWSVGVDVVSSAVDKVSQAFKTLFRASG